MKKHWLVVAMSCAVAACSANVQIGQVSAPEPEISHSAFASTYSAQAHRPFLLTNVNVYTGNGDELRGVEVLVAEGKIEAVGSNLDRAGNPLIIDGDGRWVTPGLIDAHSHMGVYPAPATSNHADGNEMTSPETARVWAEHSVWPLDPQFEKALAGGVTTFQVLPGSANLFGGRGVTLKNVSSNTVQGMKFPGAKHSLKMACGENPKRVYGGKGKAPSTRMGNMAGFRTAWIDAQEYRQKWRDFESGKSDKEPKRDLGKETLMQVLDGEILIHNHCYRADEMAQMIDMSKEFGYKITAFHHGVEAYKIAPMLAEEGICGVVWADWWGFKQEAFDMVRENLALLDMVGACAVIHSDDETQIQRLNQEIAKARAAGNAMGLNISKGQAMRWLTLNPAKSLGLDDTIGSIEIGKNADLVLWSADPFSVYAKADHVWIDGVEQFSRTGRNPTPTRDFNLGILSAEEDRP